MLGVHMQVYCKLSLLPNCSLFVDNLTTCQAMSSVAEELIDNAYGTNNCTLSSDCLEVVCFRGDALSSQLILLPCFSPPAVRIILPGINFDYIFYQSKGDIIDQNRIRVTLEHLGNGTIGLEVCLIGSTFCLLLSPNTLVN